MNQGPKGPAEDYLTQPLEEKRLIQKVKEYPG